MLNILIGGVHAATSDCILPQHSLRKTVLSYSSLNNLYILFFVFKMLKIIELPTPCEARQVVRFLSARNLYVADIHRQICEAYEAIATYKGKVRK